MVVAWQQRPTRCPSAERSPKIIASRTRYPWALSVSSSPWWHIVTCGVAPPGTAVGERAAGYAAARAQRPTLPTSLNGGCCWLPPATTGLSAVGRHNGPPKPLGKPSTAARSVPARELQIPCQWATTVRSASDVRDPPSDAFSSARSPLHHDGRFICSPSARIGRYRWPRQRQVASGHDSAWAG